MSAQLWEIVGGADKGGVIVREGQDLKSPQAAERLSTGALVRELSFVGERLQYELVNGTGPKIGWVSIRLKDKELAIRTDDTSAPTLGLSDPAIDRPVPARAVVGPGSGYCHRWAVNIDDWNPPGEHTSSEFEFLLTLIKEDADRTQVLKFIHWADKKRAMVSRLLIRQAAASALGHTNFNNITMKRTKGRKPFLASPLPPASEAPNWNANCSHEGTWVVLSSEPYCLSGVDVAELRRHTPNGKEIDFYKSFAKNLTEEEWADVRKGGPTLDDQYEFFSRYWSAKESFVKARGDGLAYDLGKCSFRWSPLPGPPRTAYEGIVLVEGKPAPQWRFIQHRLPSEIPHWTTVARGPLDVIVDANGEFTKCLRRPQGSFVRDAWQEHLKAPSAPFDLVSIGDLVPMDDKARFVAAGGTL